MSVVKKAIDSYRESSLNIEGWVVLYTSWRSLAGMVYDLIFLYLKISEDPTVAWSGGPLENATIFKSYEDAMRAVNVLPHIKESFVIKEEERRIIKVKVQTTIDLIEDLPINLLDVLAEL